MKPEYWILIAWFIYLAILTTSIDIYSFEKSFKKQLKDNALKLILYGIGAILSIIPLLIVF